MSTKLAGGYRFVTTFEPVEHHYPGGHLDNAAAAVLLSDARHRYFGEHVRWPGIGANRLWTAVRWVMIDYETEAFPDEVLFGGVRVTARGRTSLKLQQALWTAETGRNVVGCQAVVVTLDSGTRRPVDIPDELWERIRNVERPLQSPAVGGEVATIVEDPADRSI